LILARTLFPQRREELLLAARRLGLNQDERAGFASGAGRLQLLVTGLSPEQAVLAAQRPGSRQGRSPGTALVCGTASELGVLATEVGVLGHEEFAVALTRALRVSSDRLPPLRVGETSFELGARTYVMGIVNVTPDSFSDGGQFLDPALAIAHGEQLAAAGADLLDIGGESTRPGAPRVSVEEELARVLPVIRGLKARTKLPLSIDTTKAAVAREAIAAGAGLVNDISGFTFDPNLAKVVADTGAACCLMHMQGTPESMQRSPEYQDVVAQVIEFLEAAIERAERAGVSRDRMVVDPGLGFGKTPGHNLFLLRRLPDLRVLGRPILVGPSRKAFLGQLVGGKPPAERVVATAGCVAVAAAEYGADFVRVHDVAEVCDALAVAEAIRSASEGGDLFGPPGL
jgi:dihydropteroate synthase